MGMLQIGIILLTLATALIHLVVLNIGMYNHDGSIDLLFTLNGLGYLAFLAAYFLPVPLAQKYHSLVRWGFIAYTLVTILAWVFMGERSPLGYADKLIEVVLIVLLFADGRQKT
jgi:hypothetical protein